MPTKFYLEILCDFASSLPNCSKCFFLSFFFWGGGIDGGGTGGTLVFKFINCCFEGQQKLHLKDNCTY